MPCSGQGARPPLETALLHEAAPHSASYSGKIIVFLSVVVGFMSVVTLSSLLSARGEDRGQFTFQQRAITMPAGYTQANVQRVPPLTQSVKQPAQILQPAWSTRLWNSMQIKVRVEEQLKSQRRAAAVVRAGAVARMSEEEQPKVSKSAVFVTIDLEPGNSEQFFEAMEKDVLGSRDKAADPGCMRFDLLKDRETPDRYYFYEAYTDDDGAAIHKTTAHYKAWSDFKASGVVKNQMVSKMETASIGDWAFQSSSKGVTRTESAVMVIVEIKPDRVNDFLEAELASATGTRKEPGNIRFDILRDRENPNKFYFYEVYVDDAAVAEHKTTPNYKAWADFKASGGVVSQSVVKLESPSVAAWAFQG